MISCNSNDNNIIDPINNNSIKLIKVFDGIYTSNYSYDNGVLSQIQTTNNINNIVEIEEYTYENSKLKKIYTYDIVSNNGITNQTIHTYNYSGNIITSSINNENGDIYTNSYTYNSSSVLTNRKEFNPNGSLNTSYDFEYYENGNVKKVIDTNNSIIHTINYLTYDLRNNFELLYLTDALIKVNVVSKNNLISTDNYTYEYEYNSNNFPTKKTTKLNGVIEEIKTFEYNL